MLDFFDLKRDSVQGAHLPLMQANSKCTRDYRRLCVISYGDTVEYPVSGNKKANGQGKGGQAEGRTAKCVMCSREARTLTVACCSHAICELCARKPEELLSKYLCALNYVQCVRCPEVLDVKQRITVTVCCKAVHCVACCDVWLYKEQCEVCKKTGRTKRIVTKPPLLCYPEDKPKCSGSRGRYLEAEDMLSSVGTVRNPASLISPYGDIFAGEAVMQPLEAHLYDYKTLEVCLRAPGKCGNPVCSSVFIDGAKAHDYRLPPLMPPSWTPNSPPDHTFAECLACVLLKQTTLAAVQAVDGHAFVSGPSLLYAWVEFDSDVDLQPVTNISTVAYAKESAGVARVTKHYHYFELNAKLCVTQGVLCLERLRAKSLSC